MTIQFTSSKLTDCTNQKWDNSYLDVNKEKGGAISVRVHAPGDQYPLTEKEGRALLAFLKAIYEQPIDF